MNRTEVKTQGLPEAPKLPPGAKLKWLGSYDWDTPGRIEALAEDMDGNLLVAIWDENRSQWGEWKPKEERIKTFPKRPLQGQEGDGFRRFMEATPLERTVAAMRLVEAIEAKIWRYSIVLVETLFRTGRWMEETQAFEDEMLNWFMISKWLRKRYGLGTWGDGNKPIERLAEKTDQVREQYTQDLIAENRRKGWRNW